MKRFHILVLVLSLLIAPIASAQSPRSRSTIPSARQPLRRHIPTTQQSELVWFEGDIPVPTVKAIIMYMSQHLNLGGPDVDIYRVPNTEHFYLVQAISTTGADPNEEENVLLVLQETEAAVEEVSRLLVPNDDGIPNHFWTISSRPIFFIVKDRLLIFVAMQTTDGSYLGDAAFEYTSNTLRSIGVFDVFDLPKGRCDESIGIDGNSTMSRATAEYKGGTYFLTIRGKGNLCSYDPNSASSKRLAPPRVPLTYMLDGITWRPMLSKYKSQR